MDGLGLTVCPIFVMLGISKWVNLFSRSAENHWFSVLKTSVDPDQLASDDQKLHCFPFCL